jgi:hypothetical protein
MNHLSPTTLEERLRLHELARQRAVALRREALDDVWRGANAVLARAGAQALRSAQRLAYRLARRAAQRGTVPAPASPTPAATPDSKALRALERVLG